MYTDYRKSFIRTVRNEASYTLLTGYYHIQESKHALGKVF